MGWLNTEKTPSQWDSSYFRQFVERLRTALNYLDASNFPEGIHGSLLNKRTVSTGALANFSYEQVFFSQATPFTTTSTTAVSVGSLIQWDSATWGTGNVKVMLEVVGGVANASATATFELWGADGKLATITSQSASAVLLRSTAFSPPDKGQTMIVKAYTNNATYSANILSAKLIIVPGN